MSLDERASRASVSKLQRLTQAAKRKNLTALQELITPADQRSYADDNELRITLQKASEAGNEAVVRLLLESGAKTDVVKGDSLPPLSRAIERDHLGVAEALIQHGADIEAKDRSGRSVISYAANRGRNKHLTLLLQSGANVNALDSNGQSVLHHLAADTREPFKWNDETISILLSADIDTDWKDNFGRTVLHWIAATGKVSLARSVLSKSSATVSVPAHRGKTALHLAAERGHSDIVSLLLDHGAEREATSDGNWTPLLNAAKEGHEHVVDILLRVSANPNVRTSSGRTALHWAADQGHLEVVRRILVEPTSAKNTKDNSESTPYSLAAHKDNREIMHILQPYVHGGGLSDYARYACERFTAAIVDFYLDGKTPSQNKRSVMVQRRSVYDVLYTPKSKPKLHKGESVDQSHDRNKDGFLYTTNLKTIKGTVPAFRWIHLPANNVAWAEALIMKYFIEHGDLAVYQSMLQSLEDQQHRGPQVHSLYMRPVFEEVWKAGVLTPPQQSAKPKGVGKLSGAVSGTTQNAASSPQPNSAPPKSIFTLYMPYLHWETDENRARTSQTIRRVQNSPSQWSDSAVDQEEALLRGYLKSGGLQIRRTLDQFQHQTVSTDHRDRDQVVLRHCLRTKTELKIFMVDQLWMWIIGDDLVFTCFPERAQQPPNDPLNIFGGVIEDLYTTKRAVTSTYELATAITNRCISTFARHQSSLQEFSFLEMVDTAIGTLTRRETALFVRFQRDAALVANETNNFGQLSRLFSEQYGPDDESTAFGQENEEDDRLVDGTQNKSKESHRLVDRLWSVTKEARLIVECKDISDELGILTTVYKQGQQVLRDMERAFRDTSNLGHEKKFNLLKNLAQQQRMIDSKLLDIDRMDKGAKSVYDNLFEVLDLKQKHANSVEVRISRDRALEATQQGRTILVFTIVTIIFLPMSFLAGFFAINIVEFPYVSNGTGLHLSFVAKFMFGISLAVSLPLIAMAYAFGHIGGWLRRVWRWSGSWMKVRHSVKGRKAAPGNDTPVNDSQRRSSSESFHSRATKSVENEGRIMTYGLGIRASQESSTRRRLQRAEREKSAMPTWSPDIEAGLVPQHR